MVLGMNTALPRTASFNPVAMTAVTTMPATAPPTAEQKEKEQSPEDYPDQPTARHRPASFLGPFVCPFFFSPIGKGRIRHAILLVPPCLLIFKDLRSQDDINVAT